MESSKTPRYKINTHKLIAFLHASNKYMGSKNKNESHLQPLKNKNKADFKK